MLNLTETNKIKEEINSNPSDFQSIIDKTDIGICITNEDGNYAAVNPAYMSITGYDKSELIGESFLKVVPDKDQEELTDKHEQFIEVQIEMFDTFRIVGKDGNLIDINVDAGFSDKINNGPHKITFIQKA